MCLSVTEGCVVFCDTGIPVVFQRDADLRSASRFHSLEFSAGGSGPNRQQPVKGKNAFGTGHLAPAAGSQVSANLSNLVSHLLRTSFLTSPLRHAQL
jgi:hypothetical protein